MKMLIRSSVLLFLASLSFLTSSLSSSTNKRCPRNYKKKLQECGNISVKFGRASLAEQKAMCNEMYRGVECLVNIQKYCDVYQSSRGPKDFQLVMYTGLYGICPPKGLGKSRVDVINQNEKNCTKILSKCSSMTRRTLRLREKGASNLCKYHRGTVQCSLYYADTCLGKEEQVYRTEFAPYVRTYIRYCSSNNKRPSKNRTKPGVVSGEVNGVSKAACPQSKYDKMMVQCSAIAQQAFHKTKDTCKYLKIKMNCVINVFDECRNIIQQQPQLVLDSEHDFVKSSKRCNLDFRKQLITVLNNKGSLVETEGHQQPQNSSNCEELGKKCAAIAEKANVRNCAIMKASYKCMDTFIETCRWMLPADVVKSLTESRTDAFNQCSMGSELMTEDDKIKAQNDAAISTVSYSYNQPSNQVPKITLAECNMLIKTCSVMLLKGQSKGTTHCRNAQKIYQCLMSTIQMCAFVVSPDTIRKLRFTSDKYEECIKDPCPLPNQDFENCENMMANVSAEGLCEVGTITLKCYKNYMGRCLTKMNEYMKGGVVSFEKIMLDNCEIGLHSISYAAENQIEIN